MLKSHNAIICIVLILLALGIVMVYSSSFIQAEQGGKFNDGYFFFRKQIIWLIVGLCVMMLATRISYQFWRKIDWLILGVMFIMLIAVLIPGLGQSYGHARRWFRFGGIGFQPSEFAKLALVIFLASFLSKDPDRVKKFKKGFLPLVLIVSTACILILLEPDIGTAVFLGLVSGTLLFVGGIRLLHILPATICLVPPTFFLALAKFPHIKNRLTAFFNPAAHITDSSYQINQALIGLGTGGKFGVGPGLSKQKLFFLPQEHTDFILAIIGEELGFLGTVGVVLLFLGLLWFSYRVFMKQSDPFGKLLALGITMTIALQAAINIAVVTASIPTKGISLPFISFGGSSIICFMFGIGILLNIAQQAENEPRTTNNKLP